jgi:hypothetical protein
VRGRGKVKWENKISKQKNIRETDREEEFAFPKRNTSQDSLYSSWVMAEHK